MYKQIKLIAFVLLFACSAHAQFFSTLQKPKAPAGHALVAAAEIPVAKNEFRPILNVFSSAIQLNSKGSAQTSVSALTGGGVSYQHLVYNPSTERWSSTWSVNALAWYSTNVAGDQSKVFMYGLALGLLNNNVLIGAATDGGGKFAVTAGFGINFNN